MLLRGVNVAQSFKYRDPSTPDIYFGKVTEGDFTWLRRNWGFDFVRLLFEWYAFEPTEGVWDDKYLGNYAKRVSWATENDLFILVDMHQDLYGEGFHDNGAPAWTCDSRYYRDALEHWLPIWWMNYFQGGVIACYDNFWESRDYLWKHFATTWSKVAERLRDEPGVVGFEFLNEPFPGSFSPSEFDRILFDFYSYVGRAIREKAPDKLLFFEPSVLRGAGIISTIPPLPFDQIVYAPHYYDQTIHEGGDYTSSKKGIYYGILTDRLQEAKYQKAALVLGEYGAWGPDLLGSAAYLDDLMDVADQLKIGAAYWEFNFLKNNFETFPPQFIHSLARGYPEKWKGDLNFEYDYEEIKLKITWQCNKGDDLLVTLPLLSFNHDIEVTGGAISWNWTNDYQIKIVAQEGGVHTIEISKAH